MKIVETRTTRLRVGFESTYEINMDPSGFEPEASPLQRERSTVELRARAIKKSRQSNCAALVAAFPVKENKKEVIHPQVPLQIPCDDLTHLTDLWFAAIKKLKLTTSLLGWFDGRCVQGAGTYSPDDDNI